MSLSYLYSSFVAKIFATAVSLFAGIVSLKLVSEYLTLSQFGLFMVAAQLLAYLPFIDGGLRTVINRELLAGTEETRRKLLEFSQTFYTWFGVLLLPLVTLVMVIYWATPNAARSGEPLLFFIAMGFSVALLVFAFAQANLLIGLQSQSTLFWITGLSNLLQLVLLFLGFTMGWQLWAYPFANTAAFLLTWPLIAFSIRRAVPGLKLVNLLLDSEFWAQLRSLRHAAWHSFLSQVSIFLLFTVDLVIVGLWVSLPEAALYALLLRVLGIAKSFIQSVAEVSWPLLAGNAAAGGAMSRVLLNLNAWIYGAVTAIMAIFLLPLLSWYMGNEWVASETLLFLMLARFLIVGIQSPAAYFLIALGKFAVLARALWRELLVAVVLALLLLPWGAIGVALGFLASTVMGTGYRIPAAVARSYEQSAILLLSSIWCRALAVGAITLLAGWALHPMFPGVYAALGASITAVIGFGVALSFALCRFFLGRSQAPLTLKRLAKFI